jgi:hypothetical protein
MTDAAGSVSLTLVKVGFGPTAEIPYSSECVEYTEPGD